MTTLTWTWGSRWVFVGVVTGMLSVVSGCAISSPPSQQSRFEAVRADSVATAMVPDPGVRMMIIHVSQGDKDIQDSLPWGCDHGVYLSQAVVQKANRALQDSTLRVVRVEQTKIQGFITSITIVGYRKP